MALLLDTHTWIWGLKDKHLISETARTAIADDDVILLSPVSFYEFGQKFRKGEWPGVEEIVGESVFEELPAATDAACIQIAPFDFETALNASMLNWRHRDPFDRIIAATAIISDATLVSKDMEFDNLSDPRLTRIW